MAGRIAIHKIDHTLQFPLQLVVGLWLKAGKRNMCTEQNVSLLGHVLKENEDASFSFLLFRMWIWWLDNVVDTVDALLSSPFLSQNPLTPGCWKAHSCPLLQGIIPSRSFFLEGAQQFQSLYFGLWGGSRILRIVEQKGRRKLLHCGLWLPASGVLCVRYLGSIWDVKNNDHSLSVPLAFVRRGGKNHCLLVPVIVCSV